MANPTTNYGFVLPTSTDLVTDLPADFDVALQGVDTRLKALQPGTTTGDLVYSSATANTNTRLGIGSTGQVLTVASGVPSWATPSASTPTFVGCHLYKSAAQTISNATDTAITWNSEQFDTDAFHSTSTNTSRITIPAGKAGKYLFTARILWATNSTGSRELKFFKNGSEQFWSSSATAATQTTTQYSTIWDAAVADYYEVYFWQNSGGNLDSIGGLSAEFSCQYLGA